MDTELTLYDCSRIITAIEAIAEENEGEITDEQLQALVQAQTTSMTKLGNLCAFIRHVEGRINLCKEEEQRLAARRKAAENRLESVKRFLTPFVSEQRAKLGRPLEVGTFSLSTRRSESVSIDEERFFTKANTKSYCVEKVSYQPDKKFIKDMLKGGTEIEGAMLVENESLQIR
jgi:hypothetical protein